MRPTGNTISALSPLNEAPAGRESVSPAGAFPASRLPEQQSCHAVGLERADDSAIWEYAKSNGYVIVTRDADFEELCSVRGHPPQIVWLKMRNLSKPAALNLLKHNRELIEQALVEERLACIELRAPL